MTPEQEALGRRAVACPGWRWLRACPWGHPPSGEWGVADGMFPPPGGALPDFSEPAGVGCLGALAREALGEPLAHVVPFPTHVSDPIFGGLIPALWWAISTSEDSAPRFFPSDGGPSWAMAGPAPVDAWVAALEAAGRNQCEPDAPVSGGRSGASRAV